MARVTAKLQAGSSESSKIVRGFDDTPGSTHGILNTDNLESSALASISGDFKIRTPIHPPVGPSTSGVVASQAGVRARAARSRRFGSIDGVSSLARVSRQSISGSATPSATLAPVFDINKVSAKLQAMD